jgi:hypothetical protein
MGNALIRITAETSEIKGKKAMAFSAVMLIGLFLALAMSPHREAARVMMKFVFFSSAVVWALSKTLPNGWLDLKRTIALAVGLSGGLVLAVYTTATLLR